MSGLGSELIEENNPTMWLLMEGTEYWANPNPASELIHQTLISLVQYSVRICYLIVSINMIPIDIYVYVDIDTHVQICLFLEYG